MNAYELFQRTKQADEDDNGGGVMPYAIGAGAGMLGMHMMGNKAPVPVPTAAPVKGSFVSNVAGHLMGHPEHGIAGIVATGIGAAAMSPTGQKFIKSMGSAFKQQMSGAGGAIDRHLTGFANKIHEVGGTTAPRAPNVAMPINGSRPNINTQATPGDLLRGKSQLTAPGPPQQMGKKIQPTGVAPSGAEGRGTVASGRQVVNTPTQHPGFDGDRPKAFVKQVIPGGANNLRERFKQKTAAACLLMFGIEDDSLFDFDNPMHCKTAALVCADDARQAIAVWENAPVWEKAAAATYMEQAVADASFAQETFEHLAKMACERLEKAGYEVVEKQADDSTGSAILGAGLGVGGLLAYQHMKGQAATSAPAAIESPKPEVAERPGFVRRFLDERKAEKLRVRGNAHTADHIAAVGKGLSQGGFNPAGVTDLEHLAGLFKRGSDDMSHASIEDRFDPLPYSDDKHQQENAMESQYLQTGNDFGDPTSRRNHLLETAGTMVGGAAGLGVGAAAMHASARMGVGRAVAPLMPVAGMIGGMWAGHHATKGAADDDLPMEVDHPYMNQLANSVGGSLIGGLGGAALGAALGGSAGAAAGAGLGSFTGGAAGQVKAVLDHDRAARGFENAHREALPFAVRHPYLTDMGIQAVLPGLGRLGSTALHYTEKNRLKDRLGQDD